MPQRTRSMVEPGRAPRPPAMSRLPAPGYPTSPMNMLAPSRAAAWSFAAMVTFATLRANADLPKAQCVAAHTNGQSLRRQGKLAEARDQLRMCSDPKCPMSTDCIRRLDELENAQPTVVFDVKDSSGHDLS